MAVLDPRATSRRSLGVPVRQGHHHELQSAQLLVPTNGLSFQAQLCSSNIFVTGGIVELESCVVERAVAFVDAVAGALQRGGAGNGAGGDEVGFLGEVAARRRATRTAKRLASAPPAPISRATLPPRPSRTDTVGCEPVVCSSRNRNGGCGPLPAGPGP